MPKDREPEPMICHTKRESNWLCIGTIVLMFLAGFIGWCGGWNNAQFEFKQEAVKNGCANIQMRQWEDWDTFKWMKHDQKN